MDYYVVLGVTEEADEETIRSAFRGLARRFHRMSAQGRHRHNFSALVKRMRRSWIQNGVAGTTINCERLVINRSSSGK